MKISKQARRDGKALFRSSFRAGQLSEELVRASVKRMLETRPRGYMGALTHFQRLLKLHLESRRARVENAVPTSPELRRAVQHALEARYGPGLDLTFAVNPALLGGLRIRVGSDVYDGSVQSKLEGLKANF
jgi:F-type H+-transporting ATPase subunit delta